MLSLLPAPSEPPPLLGDGAGATAMALEFRAARVAARSVADTSAMTAYLLRLQLNVGSSRQELNVGSK